MLLNKLVDELSTLSRHALLSLVPLTAAFLVTGYVSHSLTIVSIALESGFSIVVQLFYYKSIRAMRSADPIRFPHGTGKLENFSGFLYGALNIPVGVYILWQAVQHLLHPPAHISFSIAQLPMLPSLIRSIYLYLFARRLARAFDSPLVESFLVDFRVAVWFDVLVILAMGIGLAMALSGATARASYIDSLFSLGVALYMLRAAAGQLIKNFRVLIDLPMPEDEQLAIIRALAAEFDGYEQIGAIRTRRSGMHRPIDVELYFRGDVDVSRIAALNARLEERLQAVLKDVQLHIIVREMPPASWDQYFH